MKIVGSLLLLSSLAAAAPARDALPFIDDDYAKARADALARHVPLFVDVWAPWCHSCVFLRSAIFTDPALAREAPRFVWLAIDTERDSNAAVLEKFPISVWPTLLVIDPASEAVLLKWIGTASVPEFVRLLDDGERAARHQSDAGGADAGLAAADALAGAGKTSDAANAYHAALARGGSAWAHRDRAAASLVMMHFAAHDRAECARAAVELGPSLTRGPAFAQVVTTGLDCALDDQAPASARATLEPLVMEARTRADVSADDRLACFETLVAARKKAGDAPGAHALATEWWAFVERESSRAATPEARASFDSARVLAAIALDDPARALPGLARTERELPSDYNAARRIAKIELARGFFVKALDASDRALALVYGPRRIALLADRAAILDNLGRGVEARQAREQALALFASLPPARAHGYQPIADTIRATH